MGMHIEGTIQWFDDLDAGRRPWWILPIRTLDSTVDFTTTCSRWIGSLGERNDSQQETFILTGISLMTPESHDPARALLKHQVREILACSV